jgi:prevent-host-death family protein
MSESFNAPSGPLKAWAVQDAKARFSEFLDDCLKHGPQLVTRRGSEAAVMVPFSQWQSMQLKAKPSLESFLQSSRGRGDLILPVRGNAKRREPPTL